MAQYRLYRLDGAGNISAAEWIEAKGDDEAVRAARGRALGTRAEIWDRDRLVARIVPD